MRKLILLSAACCVVLAALAETQEKMQFNLHKAQLLIGIF